jgi:hypothetical protein
MKFNHLPNMRFPFSIFIILIFAPSLMADQSEPIQISFSALSVNKHITDLVYSNRGQVQTVKIPTTVRSKLVQYSGMPTIIFYRKQDSVQNAENLVEVARITVSGTDSRYLFIFSENATGGYDITPIPDSMTEFGAGCYRFINFTSNPIAIDLAGQREVIKARNITDIKGKLAEDNYYNTILVSLPEDEEPKVSFKGQVYFSPNKRMLFLVLPKTNGRKGAIRLIGIPERVDSKIPEQNRSSPPENRS